MRRLVLIVMVLAASIPAFADPTNVAFISFNNSGQWQNGYPYYLYVQGTGILPMMCDDYVHAGNADWAWQANTTDLGSKKLSLTRFGDLNGALTLYDEAGWLLLQTHSQGINQWTDM